MLPHVSGTDFHLKEVAAGDQKDLPALVNPGSQHPLYYKKDNKFNVPKGSHWWNIMIFFKIHSVNIIFGLLKWQSQIYTVKNKFSTDFYVLGLLKP